MHWLKLFCLVFGGTMNFLFFPFPLLIFCEMRKNNHSEALAFQSVFSTLNSQLSLFCAGCLQNGPIGALNMFSGPVKLVCMPALNLLLSYEKPWGLCEGS